MNNRRFYLLLMIGFIPFFVNDLYLPIVNKKLFWVLDALTFVVIPTVIYIILIKAKKSTNRELGLSYYVDEKLSPIKNFLLFIFLLLIFPILALVANYTFHTTLSSFFPKNFLETPFSYLSLIPKKGIYHLIIILYFSLTAGITEEFYFRALFYKILIKRNPFIYIFISSLLFGIIHWGDGIISILSSFLFGIIFAFFYYKTRNLIVLIFSHFIVNLVNFEVMVLTSP